MIRILTDRDRINAAQTVLEEQLKSGAEASDRVWLGYQGGAENVEAHWLPQLGIWSAFRIEGDNRYWNAFGLGDPFEVTGTTVDIVVEINPPLEGIDRRIAGAFGCDADENLYLLHRGKIGGGREGVGKENFLDFYQREGALRTIKDGDRETKVIVVACLGEPQAAAQVAGFVESVAKFKRLVTSDDSESPQPDDSFSPEFFGQKTLGPRGEVVADCDHGGVVNQLERVVRAKGFRTAKDQPRDLYLVDTTGEPTHLFEVKTSSDPYSIYMALGQLFFHAPPGKPTTRVAVLPDDTSDELATHLERCGVRIILYSWDGEVAKFEELDSVLGGAR